MRAAASSKASGVLSRLSHIAATSSELCSVNAKSGLLDCARAVKTSIAAASGRPCNAMLCSPSIRRRIRLVASIATAVDVNSELSSRAASTTCSTLSRTRVPYGQPGHERPFRQ